jgi:hypothetical protein
MSREEKKALEKNLVAIIEGYMNPEHEHELKLVLDDAEGIVLASALTLEEVKSQKRLAWTSLVLGSLAFMVVSPYNTYHITNHPKVLVD